MEKVKEEIEAIKKTKEAQEQIRLNQELNRKTIEKQNQTAEFQRKSAELQFKILQNYWEQTQIGNSPPLPAHLLFPTPPMSAGSFNFPPSQRYTLKKYDQFVLKLLAALWELLYCLYNFTKFLQQK